MVLHNKYKALNLRLKLIIYETVFRNHSLHAEKSALGNSLFPLRSDVKIE